MSKPKLYGVVTSRAARNMWLLEELGVAYEQAPVHFAGGGTKSPDYLKINPNARVPALQDGDLILWESMAINLYLAKKHDKGLWPRTPEDEARTLQWSFWVVTEIEKPLLTVAMQRVFLPPEKRDPKAEAEAATQLERPFDVLEGALAGRTHLLGADFTVADLNVASVLAWARPARIDLGGRPNLSAWLERCLNRPAQLKVRKLREDFIRQAKAS